MQRQALLRGGATFTRYELSRIECHVALVVPHSVFRLFISPPHSTDYEDQANTRDAVALLILVRRLIEDSLAGGCASSASGRHDSRVDRNVAGIANAALPANGRNQSEP